MTPDVFAIGIVSSAVLWLGRIVLRKELFEHAQRIESRNQADIDVTLDVIGRLRRELAESRAANAVHRRQIATLTEQIEALTSGGPYRAGGDR